MQHIFSATNSLHEWNKIKVQDTLLSFATWTLHSLELRSLVRYQLHTILSSLCFANGVSPKI